MIETAVIIANWNGKKYLKDCFDSLRKQSYKDFKTILVDNGSEDGSVVFLQENYPEIEILELSKNTGFCFAYNKGIAMAFENYNAKYIIVLNNDTKLHEKFIEDMILCGKKDPEIGSVQPKVTNFFEQDKIDCAGIEIAKDGTAHNRGHGQGENKFNQAEEIFGANGTASLFTREALEKTKLSREEYFDNSHFVFYEDVDLAWRLRLAGFKSYYCPQAKVFHVHSGTAGKASLLKAFYLHRNYFLTVFKNYPSGIMLKTLSWRILSYIKLVFGVFRGGKKASEYAQGVGKSRVGLVILKAWASVICALPGIIAKRRFVQRHKKVNNKEIRLWLNRYRANI
jgi:GT2 family glycosyltransferase